MKRLLETRSKTLQRVSSTVLVQVEPVERCSEIADLFAESVSRIEHPCLLFGEVSQVSPSSFELRLSLQLQRIADAPQVTKEIVSEVSRLMPDLESDRISTGSNFLTPALHALGTESKNCKCGRSIDRLLASWNTGYSASSRVAQCACGKPKIEWNIQFHPRWVSDEFCGRVDLAFRDSDGCGSRSGMAERRSVSDAG